MRGVASSMVFTVLHAKCWKILIQQCINFLTTDKRMKDSVVERQILYSENIPAEEGTLINNYFNDVLLRFVHSHLPPKSYSDNISTISNIVDKLFSRRAILNNAYELLLLSCLENTVEVCRQQLLTHMTKYHLLEVLDSRIEETDMRDITNDTTYFFRVPIPTFHRPDKERIFQSLAQLFPIFEQLVGDIDFQMLLGSVHHGWTITDIKLGTAQRYDLFIHDYVNDEDYGYRTRPIHSAFTRECEIDRNDKHKHNIFILMPVEVELRNGMRTHKQYIELRLFTLTVHEPGNIHYDEMTKYGYEYANHGYDSTIFTLNMSGWSQWHIKDMDVNCSLDIIFGYLYDDTHHTNETKLAVLDEFCDLFLTGRPSSERRLRHFQRSFYARMNDDKKFLNISSSNTVQVQDPDILQTVLFDGSGSVRMNGDYDPKTAKWYGSRRKIKDADRVFIFDNGSFALPHIVFLHNTYFHMRHVVDGLINSFMLNRYPVFHVDSISPETIDSTYY
jgi:hypothetical protein